MRFECVLTEHSCQPSILCENGVQNLFRYDSGEGRATDKERDTSQDRARADLLRALFPSHDSGRPYDDHCYTRTREHTEENRATLMILLSFSRNSEHLNIVILIFILTHPRPPSRDRQQSCAAESIRMIIILYKQWTCSTGCVPQGL